MAEFTALDMIVLIAMGFGAFMGFMRGFVQEALSLACWAIVILALKFLHAPFTNFLLAHTEHNSGAASVIVFAGIVALFFGGGRFVARRLGEGSRESFLGPVDRLLGIGFGAIKGLVAVTLLFLLVNLGTDIIWGHGAKRPAWMENSRTYPLLNASSRAIVDFVERRRQGGFIDDASSTKSTKARK